MAFTNGARLAMLWLPAEAARLLSHLIGAPDDVIRTDVPQHPEMWGDICGWYSLPAGSPICAHGPCSAPGPRFSSVAGSSCFGP